MNTKNILEISKSLLIKKFFLTLFFLTPLYVVLYKILIPHINAFGCFDDCFNFMGGYFMLNHKQLYSQIFFNHQMLMAYLSFLIQYVTHPINIYELILRHRQVLFVFGFLMDFLIIYRFKWTGVGFVLFYEFSKFYIFGDRFLAESFIVYPLVYMLGLVLEKFNDGKTFKTEYMLAALFTWFVIFMREPFIPLAIIIFILILIDKNDFKIKILSVSVFVILTLLILGSIPLKDYLFQIVTVNNQTIIQDQFQSTTPLNSFLKSFLYSIYLFFGGEWNMFRYFLLVLDGVFLTLILYDFLKTRKVKTPLLIVLILGFANLRPVSPGTVFYASFHMIPWLGIFIFSLFYLLAKIYNINKKVSFTLTFILALGFCYLTLSPQSYLREKPNPQVDLLTNYGVSLQVGEAVKALSSPRDTLFSDAGDDLIYWQSKSLSPYKYSWYTSVMPRFPIYTNARLQMFHTNPPDFYYDFCTKTAPLHSSLPDFAKPLYQQVHSGGKPSCLYIKKTKIKVIQKIQWEKAKQFFYELPKV